MKKSYYYDIDIIRIISCIFVFLYHIGLVEGGFLAVCTFFVLTSFLSCISAFKHEKFNLLKYYITRIYRVYIPMVVVIFISIGVIALFKEYNWLNLKPEAFSILGGYNNFWQLNTNLDYFARHIASPFMHCWYLGILLQFELVFPFIFMLLKRLGKNNKGKRPIRILFLLSVISTGYFIYQGHNSSRIFLYYDTFSRSFSLIYGLLFGFMYHYYGSFVNGFIYNNKILNRLMFLLYLGALIFLCIVISDKSKFLIASMILVSVISLRLIDYSLIYKGKIPILNILGKITYPVYLVQYPVIFIFGYMGITNYYFEVLLILIISIIISFTFDKHDKKITKYINYVFLVIILFFSIIGFIKFVKAKDYSEDMIKLKEELKVNQSKIDEYNEAYFKTLKSEEEEWNNILTSLDNDKEALKEKVKELSIVCVGDSVMLGAVPTLKSTFKNGYFDAEISRTCYKANPILSDLKKKNMLGNPIVMNFGANGDCNNKAKLDTLTTIGDRDVFWMTVTNDSSVHFNDKIKKFATEHDNLHIIDWEQISKGHSEYFAADGIHLTSSGRKAFTDSIYDAIYNLYLERYNTEKEKILKEHEEAQNNKFTYFGNDLLIGLSSYFEDNSNNKYITNSKYNFKTLKSDLETIKDNKTITKNIVLVFDKSMKLNIDDYKDIISVLSDTNLYIINVTNLDLSSIKSENVFVFDFYNELLSNEKYLLSDGLHLSNDGNSALYSFIKENVK